MVHPLSPDSPPWCSSRLLASLGTFSTPRYIWIDATSQNTSSFKALIPSGLAVVTLAIGKVGSRLYTLFVRVVIRVLPFGPRKPNKYKKLRYRRETARQLPTWRGHSPPPLATPMRTVESETRNKRTCTSSVPSVKHTLSWIGHSRSFKVILICAERNPEGCIVVMSN